MVRFLIAAVVVLWTASGLDARQSGIKPEDLPRDPVIPIPLFHPRADLVAPVQQRGLLSPIEITASADVLRIQAGILQLSTKRLILTRSHYLEVIAKNDEIALNSPGKTHATGRRVTFNKSMDALTLKGDTGNEVFVSWMHGGLVFCFD
jgi:hypothetical protein